ncbi:MAG: hypothetical protein ACYDCD_13170 [Candidatus Acidiferrales bacterium]
MKDVKAVVNDHGVVLYVTPLTDSVALALLLEQLGGDRSGPHAAWQIPIYFGNGLTKELARTVLKRRGVQFEEHPRAASGAQISPVKS